MKKFWIVFISVGGIIALLVTFWLFGSDFARHGAYSIQEERAANSSGEVAVVSRVIDGDTIELKDGRRVRYIGIDTPELDYKNSQHDCYGAKARERNQDLVEGKEVHLVRDVSETDKYDRLLRYVYAGDIFVNKVLVREGYARVIAIKPDTELYGALKEVEEDAKSQQRGMWANGTCEKENFIAPIDRAGERVTKKPFGIFISPETSPVQPERFSGYHTGTDFEVFADEVGGEVAVFSICDGKIADKRTVGGYGGFIILECEYKGEPISVIYGHVSLESIVKDIGDTTEKGEVLGVLGEPSRGETDGERKHLHMSILKGDETDIRGYVAREVDLDMWLDPCTLVCD